MWSSILLKQVKFVTAEPPCAKGSAIKCTSSQSRTDSNQACCRHANKHWSAITINILHLKTFVSSYPEHKHFSERHLCDRKHFICYPPHNFLEPLNFSKLFQHFAFNTGHHEIGVEKLVPSPRSGWTRTRSTSWAIPRSRSWTQVPGQAKQVGASHPILTN